MCHQNEIYVKSWDTYGKMTLADILDELRPVKVVMYIVRAICYNIEVDRL